MTHYTGNVTRDMLPMAVSTRMRSTRAALGTLAEATEAAVEVSLQTEIVR